MQVFKAFNKIMISRFPIALIWIIIFLVISIITAKSSNDYTEFKDTKLDICVFDEDNTQESKALKEFLGNKHNLITLENDKDTILDALYYERVGYVLTISEGYAEKLKSGEINDLFTNYHVHDSYSSTLVGSLIDEYVNTVRSYLISGEDLSKAIKNAEDTLSLEADVKTESFSEGSKENAQYKSDFGYYFQYLPYVFISVIIVVLCPIITTLNNREIKNRTNCSCISSGSQSIQIILGSSLFIAAVWLFFIIAGIFVKGEFYVKREWFGVLNSFVFILVASAIAILISSFSPSSTGVNVIANIVGLGMSFLCGIFVPLSLLGDGVLKIGKFLPAYWYVKANDMIYFSSDTGESFTVSKIFEYIGIQMIFVVVLFALVMLIMKANHDKAE
ncbi:MAG: ABC transporter permease [Oscillospiraceae bacterium]|nr:ABC transporter permease [Oscillospiraceae bacterium]